MEQPIKNITLKFSCTADWENMTEVNGAKHCEQCNKKVYDFTNAKQYEFLAILAENNNSICGRFAPQQMAPISNALPRWKRWLSAAVVLLGINIFNNKAEAQTIKHKITLVKLPPQIPTVGMIGDFKAYDVMAEYPGGTDVFQKFLSKNINFSKRMRTGRIFASFNIEPNGSLSDIKILRSPGPLNNDEVIRVLNLSPKWKPATLKGKPVVCTYTIPVNFSRR